MGKNDGRISCTEDITILPSGSTIGCLIGDATNLFIDGGWASMIQQFSAIDVIVDYVISAS
jgi:hypothetical protein